MRSLTPVAPIFLTLSLALGASAALAQEAGAALPDPIDRGADVVVETAIDVLAPPDVVWGVLADVADWPEWHPAIERAALEGPMGAGGVIAWKPDATGGGWAIRSEITRAETPRGLDWQGLGDGTLGIHSWRLVPIEGGTRVLNAESFDGGLAATQTEEVGAGLEAFLIAWNEALKAEAERLASR